MKYQIIKNIGKQFTLAFSLMCLFAISAQAQRIAYVDLNKILNSMESYTQAQSELDRVASNWRQDIAQEYDKIKSMYNKYQAEQVLLSDEARKQKEDEIINKEKEVRDLQKSRFGPEGSLFKKRQELVRPIQDKVYAEIEDYASDRGYDFIFDKAGSAGMIFSNPDYDKTDDIIQRLK